jgi:hypothetical protein
MVLPIGSEQDGDAARLSHKKSQFRQKLSVMQLRKPLGLEGTSHAKSLWCHFADSNLRRNDGQTSREIRGQNRIAPHLQVVFKKLQ